MASFTQTDTEIQFTKQPYAEDVGPRKIKSIQFSMMSGTEIMKASELQVFNSGFYDQDRKPKKNALLDSRMYVNVNEILMGFTGPANKFITCATCHGSLTDCPGHYGYFHLILPVFNVGYFNAILNVLKCVCKSCARILLSERDRISYLKKMRNPKLEALQKTGLAKAILNKCKPKKCSRCGYINGVVKKSGTVMGIVHDRSKLMDGVSEECEAAISKTKDSRTSFTVVYVLNPVRVLGLFRRILDQDCDLLYLSDRPEKLIITDILVPPIAIRPSAFVDGGKNSNEDDITSKLNTIIQANTSLRQDLHCTSPTSKCLYAVLKTVTRFIQRLKGKQGRFRGNLSGKRVEYTARTVISPDPNLKITEVGIPILIAQVLTYPELVSQYNIEKLRKCVANGLKNIQGRTLNLRYGRRKGYADALKYGDTVERHLEDGDVVLFNRQPSLHRMSIMSHRAKIMPWRTLRFNESVCNPYNADFDGDEMNMHVPQTEEARTEALMLMINAANFVQNNLCTPKNGEILVASTQDFLTSSFLITRKDTFYDRASFSLMCSYMGDAMDAIDLPTPALIKPVELWTGKQLFNVLIRPHAQMRVFVNLTVFEKSYNKGRETLCPNDGFVYFRNSELICGQLGKATLGNGNKDGLFSVLLRDYDAHAAASCMNRLAKLSARWIGNHGFSIGISDVQPGKCLSDKKQKKIDMGKEKCDKLIEHYKTGKLELQPGCDAAQTLEAEITGILNNIREKAATVCMENLHWRNSPLIMSQCGSKGSPSNITQMIACVGQQSVGGRRAMNGFIDRSLPHFPRNSVTPDAKGFVENSFYTGLTATEFFFHTMGGREGLVDTAVKTADTGASGGVVQFLYGDDGMDPSRMEGKDGTPLNLDRLYMKVKATCPARGHSSLSPTEILELVVARLSKHDMTPEGGCSDAFKKSLLDEEGFMQKKEGGFLGKCITSLKNTRRDLQLDGEKRGSESLEKVSANIAGITLQQLQVFLETCISRYHLKRIEAGSAIGAIGAQSIGEPGTQMTLKTFHFAGVASMNVTLGVPRIKEIINGAKNISTPLLPLHLNIAESMKIIFTSRQACILVTLDIELIQRSQLKISAHSVQQSIWRHPKAKLKAQHVEVLDDRKLRIHAPVDDRTKIHFELHFLERSIINKLKDKSGKETGEHNLLVEGTNLRAVMGTLGVDGCNTTSNHIIEVQETLGIEAARKCIIDEINYTMKGHGMTIDIRHMMLLGDLMTSKIWHPKDERKCAYVASFEKAADHLFNASVNGRDDKIEGVSECIIMGIPMQIGTGILKLDKGKVEHLPQLDYGPESIFS
ncbi:hypothetical protein MKW92_003705 [Papaver armeniacum]|nr:hypothetical protein MKW92_003705 [Papaver armeniacum]